MAVVLKRTYSLPSDTLAEFERVVPPGERSATIAQLLRTSLDEARRRTLREEVVAGCREMAEEYLVIANEYAALEEEAQHVANGTRPARRRGPRAARSRRGIRAGR